jgi:hypothetical protein
MMNHFIRVAKPTKPNERPLLKPVDPEADRQRNRDRDSADRSRNVGVPYPLNAKQIANGILATQRAQR